MKIFFYLSFIVFLTIFLTNCSIETKYERLEADITGKVIDSATGKPIEGASVLLTTPKGNYSAITNADGYYIIRDVFIGERREAYQAWWSGKTIVRGDKVKNYLLTIEYRGYKAFKREIILGTGLNKIDDIVIETQIQSINPSEIIKVETKLKDVKLYKK